MKRRYVFTLAVLLVLALIPAFSQSLQVSYRTTGSEKLNEDARFAVVTDLHNSFFGEHQSGLIAAIDEAAPDAVLMVGDMADSADALAGVCTLAEGLYGHYPVFYVSGNHECGSEEDLAVIKNALRARGVRVLEGESVMLRSDLYIAGVDDPMLLTPSEWKSEIEACRTESDAFTLLMSHRPWRMEYYEPFDLTVCGHAHGGQIRLFGQGLWAPNQGFLPEYTSGFYDIGESQMFVSRGLAKGWLPRFINRPELAIITIEAK